MKTRVVLAQTLGFLKNKRDFVDIPLKTINVPFLAIFWPKTGVRTQFLGVDPRKSGGRVQISGGVTPDFRGPRPRFSGVFDPFGNNFPKRILFFDP